MAEKNKPIQNFILIIPNTSLSFIPNIVIKYGIA
jgi:hypothetical protein